MNTTIKKEKRIRLWKFFRIKGKGAQRTLLSFHDNSKWKTGVVRSTKGEVRACDNGFHASKKFFDAYGYGSLGGEADGAVALVEAWGECDNQGDKMCLEHMRVVKAWDLKDEKLRKAFFASFPKGRKVPKDRGRGLGMVSAALCYGYNLLVTEKGIKKVEKFLLKSKPTKFK